ncbi:MAG TPA: heavy-metal-associated domain-containing protein [Telluria sp.]|jgi:copper chaperone
MITLKVPDMSCGHCSSVITKTLKQLDPNAEIGFDMHHHMVQVETTSTPIVVVDALTAAGYPATLAY